MLPQYGEGFRGRDGAAESEGGVMNAEQKKGELTVDKVYMCINMYICFPLRDT